MSTETIYIGSCPEDEPVVHLSDHPDCQSDMLKQCRLYREALRRKFGPEPEGARLVIKKNYHDFGTYYDVECRYDPNNKEATEYAFNCEDNPPRTWEEVGMEKPIFKSPTSMI